MTIYQLTKGQRVHYKPEVGPCENGIVKAFDGGKNRVGLGRLQMRRAMGSLRGFHWLCNSVGKLARRLDMTTAPSKLTWTSEKPTQEGWYWWRFKPGKLAKIAYVQSMRAYGYRMCAWTNGWVPLEEIPQESRWAGPIPLPEEP